MSKPDFTGTWTFDPARSELQIQPPESTVFRIDHCEPSFRLERTHVFAGKRDTFSIELTTDGKEVLRTHAGMVIRATLRWDGETLVFDSSIDKDGEQASNIVRYTLAGGGRVFIAEEQFRGTSYSYDNKWIFQKQ